MTRIFTTETQRTRMFFRISLRVLRVSVVNISASAVKKVAK
jgi:hypothetical protein